jgi:hypothetical protein
MAAGRSNVRSRRAEVALQVTALGLLSDGRNFTKDSLLFQQMRPDYREQKEGCSRMEKGKSRYLRLVYWAIESDISQSSWQESL